MSGQLFGDLPMMVSLDQQIEELKRERRIRDDVYPRWIANGTLKPGAAMKRNAALDAAIATLEMLKRQSEGD